MVKYDGITSDIIVYPPLQYENTLGKVLEINNLKQLRIAETEKYAHVTFFFDGGKEINYKNEQKILIQSPNVVTYDLQPEMSANLICDKLIANFSKYDFTVCNFANCDMVGHTGVFSAAKKAVEVVDCCVNRLLDAVKKVGGVAIITADHGNAEQMQNENGEVLTSHTTNPVVFSVVFYDCKLKETGRLCDIAPTMLSILGLKKPTEMTGESLILP